MRALKDSRFECPHCRWYGTPPSTYITGKKSFPFLIYKPQRYAKSDRRKSLVLFREQGNSDHPSVVTSTRNSSAQFLLPFLTIHGLELLQFHFKVYICNPSQYVPILSHTMRTKETSLSGGVSSCSLCGVPPSPQGFSLTSMNELFLFISGRLYARSLTKFKIDDMTLKIHLKHNYAHYKYNKKGDGIHCLD